MSIKFYGPLTTEQLAALGSIALESANLEGTVDTVIAEIAKLSDTQFRILLSGAMLAAKLDILRDLAILKLKSKSKKERFSSIISELKHLNSKRTVAVHGNWQDLEMMRLSEIANGSPIERGNAEATHTRGKKPPSKLHANKLQGIADEIGEWRDQLFQFCFQLWIKPAVIRRFRRAHSKSA